MKAKIAKLKTEPKPRKMLLINGYVVRRRQFLTFSRTRRKDFSNVLQKNNVISAPKIQNCLLCVRQLNETKRCFKVVEITAFFCEFFTQKLREDKTLSGELARAVQTRDNSIIKKILWLLCVTSQTHVNPNQTLISSLTLTS